MLKKLRIAAVIVVALAVALSAGGVVVGSEQADPDNSTRLALSQQAGQEDQDNLASQAKISVKQAKEAAEEAAHGVATDVELEKENGQVVYEIEVGNKEVIVNAKNGNVLSVDQEDDDDSDDDDDDSDNN